MGTSLVCKASITLEMKEVPPQNCGRVFVTLYGVTFFDDIHVLYGVTYYLIGGITMKWDNHVWLTATT